MKTAPLLIASALVLSCAAAHKKPEPKPAAPPASACSQPDEPFDCRLPPKWIRVVPPHRTVYIGNVRTGATVFVVLMKGPSGTPAEIMNEVWTKMGTDGFAVGAVETGTVNGHPAAWFSYETENDSGQRVRGRTYMVRFSDEPDVTVGFNAKWPADDDGSMAKETRAIVNSFTLRPGRSDMFYQIRPSADKKDGAK